MNHHGRRAVGGQADESGPDRHPFVWDPDREEFVVADSGRREVADSGPDPAVDHPWARDPDLAIAALVELNAQLAAAIAGGEEEVAGLTQSNGRRRGRPVTDRMAALDEQLIELVRRYKPIGVRGTFYRAEVIHIVPKTEAAVNQVQRRLLRLRREGRIPYHWIVDDSREVYGREGYGDLDDLAGDVAGLYRKDYWRRAGCRVQFWLEKRTLKGVITPTVISKWGVQIYSCNGQLSETLLYRGGHDIKESGVETYIYVLSDFDPAGDTIFSAIARGTKAAPGGIRRFTGVVPVHVERLALTADQVAAWKLPTRPAKKTDSRSPGFIEKHGDVSVELEALAPTDLRDLCDRAIAQHMPPCELDALKVIEEEERRVAREMLEAGAKGIKAAEKKGS